MPKGYPRSRFDIVDQTQVQEIVSSVASEPAVVVMIPYTSDKGSEDWEMMYGLSQFSQRKGGINFAKHGIPQLLAAEVLRLGGYVFGKRMVADDATLANTTVKIRVVDGGDDGYYLYVYTASAVNVGNIHDAAEAGYGDFGEFDPENDIDSIEDFPLFTITASGRGASNLFVRIVPEYSTSRTSSYIRYNFEVWENQEIIETIKFCMNPDLVIDSISQSISYKLNANSNQIQVRMFEDSIYALVKKLATKATYTNGANTYRASALTLINFDFVNGCDRRGVTLGGVITGDPADEDTSDPWVANKPSDITEFYSLNGSMIPLANGSNGSIGSAPWQNQAAYNELLKGAFGKDRTSQQYDPVIYDLDYFKPTCVIDCMYSWDVKNAVIDLCEFRGDCVFLADLCDTTANKFESLGDIIANAGNINSSRYVAIYHNYFNMINPYTKKEITVSMPFLLAKRLVQYISTGIGRPFAGVANDMYFPEIITGTINFTPVVTPDEDQKQQLVDNNINYLNYYDGMPVLETMYCNAEEYTQLTYLSNIMLVQDLIRAIRTRCPRTRYTFLDGDDLEEYIRDAQYIVNQYSTMFKSVSIRYMADEAYESNNIFYATIIVQFRNFVQEEYFRVIAIS